jgi:hypothetical protein
MDQIAVFRDMSLLWLIFLTFIAVLPFGLIFFFAVRGMHRLRQAAKRHLPAAQEKARQMASATERFSQKVVDPIIGAQAKAAEVGGVAKAIFGRRERA